MLKGNHMELTEQINKLRGISNKSICQDNAANIETSKVSAKNIDLSEYINENTKYDEFGMPIIDMTDKSL